MNRRVTEAYPDAAPNTKTFTYDAVGNLLTRTQQNGLVTTYSYNDLYYLTNRATAGFPSDQFTYDAGGRMLSATRTNWVVTFQYDAANRTTNTTQNGLAIDYAYDTTNRTRKVTYPSGQLITETKDLRDRLFTVGDTGGMITAYAYDLGNRVTTRTYTNGVVATYSYNANNWITNLVHTAGITTIAGFAHAYDKEGNKLYEQKLHQTTNSEAYQYDDLYRLVDYKVGTLSGSSIPTPITQSAWQLDPVGNWDSKTTDSVTETRTHNAANEITAIDSTNLTHDANGNLTADLTQAHQYDEENRLVVASAVPSGVLGQYAYDALGRRVSKVTGTGTTVFYYDEARIIEERDAGNVTQATYTYGNYVDEVLTMDRASTRYFYHQNTLWSVHALTDATGTVVERYSYDAYGKLTVLSPSYTPLSTAPLAYFTYTGRESDFESGTYHYCARTYSATLGRFLSRDPLGYVDGLNLYEYVANSPTAFTDPYGLYKIDGPHIQYVPMSSLGGAGGYTLPVPHVDQGLDIEFNDKKCECSVKKVETIRLQIDVLVAKAGTFGYGAWATSTFQNKALKHEMKHVAIAKHYGKVFVLYEKWQKSQKETALTEGECKQKLETKIHNCRDKAVTDWAAWYGADSGALDGTEGIIQKWGQVPTKWVTGSGSGVTGAWVWDVTGNYKLNFKPVKLNCP